MSQTVRRKRGLRLLAWAGGIAVAVALVAALVKLGVLAWVASRDPSQPWATIMTGVGVIVAAVITLFWNLRAQKLTEKHFAREREETTVHGLRARYTEAASQLGNSSAAVRLAGVYAMAALADDWLRRRDHTEAQTCVDVLCAYLRMEPDGGDPRESETRATIITVLRNHLREPAADTSWCGMDIDLTGAHLESANFAGASFLGSRVSMRGATFSGPVLSFAEVTFSRCKVSFDGATFPTDCWIRFDKTVFSACGVSFIGARCPGGCQVLFREATFSENGKVVFDYDATTLRECGVQLTSNEEAAKSGRIRPVGESTFPA